MAGPGYTETDAGRAEPAIDIHDKDYDDTDQVDAKLIRQRTWAASKITNDYNLKVASARAWRY